MHQIYKNKTKYTNADMFRPEISGNRLNISEILKNCYNLSQQTNTTASDLQE